MTDLKSIQLDSYYIPESYQTASFPAEPIHVYIIISLKSQFDNLQDALIQYNTIDQKNSNISDFRANVVCDLWC